VPGGRSERTDWPAIAAADPDVVVCMPCGYDRSGAARLIAELASNPAWTGLRAVRAGRAHAVDANGLFSRPGPRLVDGVERLAELLQVD
jgi:iron complex transport system substrate-binding protein